MTSQGNLVFFTAPAPEARVSQTTYSTAIPPSPVVRATATPRALSQASGMNTSPPAKSRPGSVAGAAEGAERSMLHMRDGGADGGPGGAFGSGTRSVS